MAWDDKAQAVLSGDWPADKMPSAAGIESAIAPDFPDQITIAFEDLAKAFEIGEVLYRARIHDDRLRREHFAAHEVGAPPKEKATAGRANRKGEPVLYLASDLSTALAEVRAWQGAAVAVSEVAVTRRLNMVNLSEFRAIESPFFDEMLRWKVRLLRLFSRLAYDLSKPVMPHEQEVLYRPTQLLAWLIRSNGYDGFLYPSAMGDGKNIVVFDSTSAEVKTPTYMRVERIGFRAKPLSPLESIYDNGPYDHALSRRT
ncbi:MAG: RES family NAD+ phosphorylase [Rhodospirillaceae bacterium]|nr:RES family NAD+ phosphorylase [Rhodospirillaceae bacterium]